MKKFDHNGITISYLDTGGNSEVLVLLHGTGGSHSYFSAQISYFKDLYRVIAVDLRGHGESSKPEAGYRVQDFSSDVVALLDHLEISKAGFVGHSLGGIIALDLAANHPEQVSSLVMIDAPILIYPHVAQAMSPFIEAFQGPEYPQALQQFASQFFFNTKSDTKLKEAILRDYREFPQHIFFPIFSHSAQFDAGEALSRVEVPALYVHSSVPTDLEQLQAAMPLLHLERVQGVGHFSQIENAALINGLIENFMRKSLLSASARPEQTQWAHS